MILRKQEEMINDHVARAKNINTVMEMFNYISLNALSAFSLAFSCTTIGKG